MSTETLPALTQEQFRDYGVRKNIIRVELEEIGEKTDRIGKELEYIRDHKLYRNEYETFAGFVNAEFGKSARWAYQQLEHIRVLTNLESDENVNPGSQNKPHEKQSRHLATLPDEEQADAWAESQEKAESEGKEKPTTKDVKETVQRRKAANGGEYRAPKTELVGPDPKEFHKHYGPLVRHLTAMDKHHKTTVFNGLTDDLEPVLKRYNQLVREFA